MADSELKCGLVLLAAGASTRMGRPKQLIKIDGVTLVRRAALAAVASPARPIVVVLGANAAEIRPQLTDLAVTVTENAEWSEGMGSSLRYGVQALTSLAPDAEAVVVALVDQPHFSTEVVQRLLDRQRETGKSIIVTSAGEHHGPPALFLRQHFADLMAARGDTGARTLINKQAEIVAQIEITDEADLDTPADVERFRSQKSRETK